MDTPPIHAFWITAIFNFGLNALLVPRFGYLAAAAITVASELVLFLPLQRTLRHEGGRIAGRRQRGDVGNRLFAQGTGQGLDLGRGSHRVSSCFRSVLRSHIEHLHPIQCRNAGYISASSFGTDSRRIGCNSLFGHCLRCLHVELEVVFLHGVHLSFRVDRPSRHSSMVMIQKRTTTWVSFQPLFSK